MRRIAAALFAACLTAAVCAAQPLTTSRSRGYVFDQPRVLTQQRLFGLAHGITLLAETCMDQAANRDAVRQAYQTWREQQAATIETARAELARYYFGERADEAKWSDIVGALGLGDRLRVKPGSPRLRAACATLPEALSHRDKDLAAQFTLQERLARLSSAAETEARAAACAALLPPNDVTSLNVALDKWHRAHDQGVSAAHAAIEQRWQEAALPGTLDAWLNQARKLGRAEASAEKCPRLAEWLATPAADPGIQFDRKP